MKRVVGVTGLACSGKSYAARLLASGKVTGETGELVLADDLGHAVLARPEVLARLRDRFGDDIDAGDRSATRARIAARVFADSAELAWLEGLVHPLVVAETDRIILAAGERMVVVEAALLFAAGMDSRCDRVLLIEADFEVRLRRAAARGWDRAELERRDRRVAPLLATPPAGVNTSILVRVRNDLDDDGLAGRMALALEHGQF